jgi:hypothetical protein
MEESMKPTAKQIAARALFAKRAKAGAFKRKKKRAVAKNPRGRSQGSVRRKSQANGKHPTPRLIQRRIKTKRAPKGLFANPVKRKLRYKVEAGSTLSQLRSIAHFEKQSAAFQYAKAFHQLHPQQFVRVSK